MFGVDCVGFGISILLNSVGCLCVVGRFWVFRCMFGFI